MPRRHFENEICAEDGGSPEAKVVDGVEREGIQQVAGVSDGDGAREFDPDEGESDDGEADDADSEGFGPLWLGDPEGKTDEDGSDYGDGYAMDDENAGGLEVVAVGGLGATRFKDFADFEDAEDGDGDTKEPFMPTRATVGERLEVSEDDGLTLQVVSSC